MADTSGPAVGSGAHSRVLATRRWSPLRLRLWRTRQHSDSSGVRAPQYDGFISYSHAADGHLAPALQRGLQRFARRWYRIRALRIFRDETSLSASPHLWGSIQEALDTSRYFILLASPEAASSPWIARETEHWRSTKPLENLVIGITDGVLLWDAAAGDFDWKLSTVLPDCLHAAFDEEPRYIDLRWARNADDLSLSHPRFREAVADFAALLHGKPKDEIASEEVREHRRTMRIARAAMMALVTLTVLAVVASVIAVAQRNTALERLRLSEARELAQRAGIYMQKDQPDKAALLAIEAYRLAPVYEARDSMLKVMETARPADFLDPITHIAFSPKGQILAFSNTNGIVTLVDTGTGRQLRVMHAQSHVTSVSFSADGSLLATGSTDGTVRLWQLHSPGSFRFRSLKGSASVTAVAFSPAGALVAIGSGNDTDLWNARTGQELHRFVSSSGSVTTLSFSPSGAAIAAGTIGGSVIVSNTGTGRSLLKIHDRGPVADIAFSTDRTIATSSGSTIAVWDLQTGRLLHSYAATSAALSTAFTADGEAVASGSQDGRVLVSVSGTGKQLIKLSMNSGPVSSVSFSRTMRPLVIAAGTAFGTLMMWSTDRRPHQLTMAPEGSNVQAVAFSRNGKMFASADAMTRTVTIWNAHSLQPLQFLNPEGRADDLAFDPTGNVLISAGPAAPVIIWNIRTGHLIHRLLGPDSGVNQVAFNSNGKLLASVNNTRSISLWNVGTAKLSRILAAGDGTVGALAFGAHGSILASAGSGNFITLWDPETGRIVRRFKVGLSGRHDRVTSLAFSSDGKTIVSSTLAGAVVVWNALNGTPLFPPLALASTTAHVSGVAFSPDGSTFAAGLSNRRIELFDTAQAQPLGDPLSNSGSSAISPLAFSPDGVTLVSGPVLRLWSPLPLSNHIVPVITALCQVAGRNLTHLEWHLLLPDESYHKTCPEWP